MIHLTDGKSFRVLLLYHIIISLLLLQSSAGQSQLIGSSQPIVATVGDDIILPCHLEPAMDVAAMTLEWTRSDSDPINVHLRRAGQDLIDANHASYRGRTSLFTDELKQGNISLKLSKVKLSDGGKYKCDIPKLNKQSFVELFVASDAVSSPVISVVLQCESKGWHPQPEVFWLDSEGNLLSAGPTETVRGPDDLYNVSSRVTVEKRHNNNFTCRVQQNKTKQTRETHIIVPDDLFMTPFDCTCLSYIISIVIIVGLFIVSIVVLLKTNKVCTKRKQESENAQKKEENDGIHNVKKQNATENKYGSFSVTNNKNQNLLMEERKEQGDTDNHYENLPTERRKEQGDTDNHYENLPTQRRKEQGDTDNHYENLPTERRKT